jgi:hypothetical protein
VNLREDAENLMAVSRFRLRFAPSAAVSASDQGCFFEAVVYNYFMNTKTCLAAVFLFFLSVTGLHAAGAKGDIPSHKPLPPLRVSILPVRADLRPDSIQPGDIVELRITAVSGIAAADMRIDLKLEGGAKLVSGNAAWEGEAALDKEITMTVSVKAPDSGKGTVRAVVSLPSARGPHFSSESEFDLGPPEKPKPGQGPVIRKNRRGRSVIEYD